jgi:prolyl oligopeptidase
MKDLENDVLTKVKFSLPLWDLDNAGFFYAKYDDAIEDGSKIDKVGPNRVYYHKVGTKQSEDILIYENPNEPDASYSVYKTVDNKYLILTTKRSTEETCLKHFVDVSSIKDYSQKFEFFPIIDEWKGSFTYLHNVGSKFYFVTNYKAPFKRIISMDILFP